MQGNHLQDGTENNNKTNGGGDGAYSKRFSSEAITRSIVPGLNFGTGDMLWAVNGQKDGNTYRAGDGSTYRSVTVHTALCYEPRCGLIPCVRLNMLDLPFSVIRCQSYGEVINP